MQRTVAAFVVLCIIAIMNMYAQEAIELPSWKGNIAVGGQMQYGNTESQSSNVSGEADYKAENYKILTRLQSNYASDDSGITARNTFIGGKYDYFFTKKTYLYVSEDLLTDEFKDLELRSTTGVGAAYQFLDDDVFNLLIEAGVSYINEDYYITENDSYTAARLAIKFKWTIGESVTFTDNLEYLPSLEEDEYLARNEATLTNALGAGWSLKLAHILQYDSEPPVGVRETDVTMSISLQYSF